MRNITLTKQGGVLNNIDINSIELLKKISENNITITTADIFYKVSGAMEASAFIQSFKAAEANLIERFVNGDSEQNIVIAKEAVEKPSLGTTFR